MRLDRRTITRFRARHRRGVAALCAALAVLSLGVSLRPPPLPVISVAVAVQALPTGHRLEARDLRSVEIPRSIGAAPAGGTAPEGFIGRVLAAPVTAGEPVSEARLVAPTVAAWAGPSGTSPLPVRFADAGAVDLIDAGQRLDVLAASGPELGGELPEARVVASGVLVLAVVRSPQSSADGLIGGGEQPTGGGSGHSDLVVLAATPQQTLALAAAEAGSRLTFSLATSDAPVAVPE
jgi:pilus assembly protein CpaB